MPYLLHTHYYRMLRAYHHYKLLEPFNEIYQYLYSPVDQRCLNVGLIYQIINQSLMNGYNG